MVRLRRRASWLAALVASVGLARSGTSARAQTPPTPAPPVVIPAVTTELLRVEVVVTDAAGRPVRGLDVGDFVVLEDGDAQTITHFRPATGTSPAPSAAPEAAEVTNGAMGRHIVLAIDDLHMSATSLSGSKEALKSFLTRRVTDEDEVALVTTSGALGPLQAFTRERAVLRRAVDRLVFRERRGNAGGRATMSEHEAEAIDGGDPLALEQAIQEVTLRQLVTPPGRVGSVQNPRAKPEVTGMARTLLAQALETTNRTLRNLETVVRGLGSVPGRKVLVLVSDGFIMGHGSQDPQAFDLRLIFDASARAGVAVYALDSHGLSAEPSSGDASSPGQLDQTHPAIRDSYRRAAELVQRENMGALAEGTGGFLVHGTNDLSQGLGLILDDSDASYLLAYSPSHGQRDGRFHTIEVRVPGHDGYTVRARKGYFAPDEHRPAPAPVAEASGGDGARRDQELRTALASLAPLPGVPLDLTAEFVDLPPAGPQLVVKARIDLSGVPFRVVDGRHRAEIDLVGLVYDEDGQVVGEIEAYRTELNLSPERYEALRREGVRYQKSVPLKPGVYQVRLAAREVSSSQLGSAFQWVEVPDLSLGTLALSGVFLSADAAKPEAAPAAEPPDLSGTLRDVQAHRRFAAGDRLYYSLYVYNPRRDESGSTDVVLQAQIWAAGKLQGVSPVEPLALGGRAEATHPITGRISLEGLVAGDYELRVLVVDRKANANATRRVTFSVG